MANVSLKADFKDGDKLFAQQLNNNFNAIMAALSAMNKIVWQDDPDDTVVTFRGTTEEINSRDIIDGQLLYDTSTGETYIDYGSQRISTGSGNAIFIGENEPTNPATQLWIDPTEPLQVINSEVINSIAGDETDKAPSVAAAKTIVQSGNNTNGKWVKFVDGTMICWDSIRVTDQAISSAYGSLYQGMRTIIFPVEFQTFPSVQCSQFQYGTGASWGAVYSNTKTQAIVRGFDITTRPVGENCDITWMAIGRWK